MKNLFRLLLFVIGVISCIHATTESLVYSFTFSGCEFKPTISVIPYNGTLYGVTPGDGCQNNSPGAKGAVYSVTTTGTTFTSLWSVPASSATPLDHPTGITFDSSGNIFGTSSGSILIGENFGTVWELTESGSSWTENTLYTFTGGTDGNGPYGGVVIDSSGNLYGTTGAGGQSNGNGYGTVYKLTKSGSTYTESIVHAFNNTDGANPYGPLLLVVSAGCNVLYGTTQNGGAHSDGTVFSLTDCSSGQTFKSLYSFKGGTTDGANPAGGVVVIGPNLIGLTNLGGANNTGTVYKIGLCATCGGIESVIYSFGTCNPDGCYPVGGTLTADSSGNLYGTTSSGGLGDGAVFKLTLNADSSYTESVIHSFTGSTSDGRRPQGTLGAISGTYYGTTVYGGANTNCDGNDCGSVFSIVP